MAMAKIFTVALMAKHMAEADKAVSARPKKNIKKFIKLAFRPGQGKNSDRNKNIRRL